MLCEVVRMVERVIKFTARKKAIRMPHVDGVIARSAISRNRSEDA